MYKGSGVTPDGFDELMARNEKAELLYAQARAADLESRKRIRRYFIGYVCFVLLVAAIVLVWFYCG